jgi:uncharacterized protein (TIGR03435 family)
MGMFAQSPIARPKFDEFEVATIKPTAPDWDGGRYMRMQTAHQFAVKNFAPRLLLAAAYNLTPGAISGGPAWVDSDHFDILAEAPGEVRPSTDEQMTMLRQLLRNSPAQLSLARRKLGKFLTVRMAEPALCGLLTDRFKLTFHREKKEFSIYALMVAKGGPKLKESTVSPDATPEGPPPLVFLLSSQGARLAGRNATMAALAAVMQRSALDRPMVDQTELSGRYDFDLDWAPDETHFGGQVRGTPASPKVDLFAAIQEQIGLRLEATGAPIETLVIDRIERPSAN